MNHNSDPTSGRTDTPDTPEVAVVDPKALVERYMALETRVARAYEEFVAPGEYVFRPRDNAARLRNLVKFNWELVSRATGEVAAVGLDVLTLDDQGRITVDYVFVEG